MNLGQYDGLRRLRIIAKNGEEYTGPVIQYCYPEDNEGIDKESLIIENVKDGHAYNFFEDNIETIEFID